MHLKMEAGFIQMLQIETLNDNPCGSCVCTVLPFFFFCGIAFQNLTKGKDDDMERCVVSVVSYLSGSYT